MKTASLTWLISVWMAGLAFGQVPGQVATRPAEPMAAPPEPMGTAFTYQGRLLFNEAPANGEYDFQFVLCDPVAGFCFDPPIWKPNVTVTDGLFTVQLDFGNGAGQFNGDRRTLNIGVGQAGGGDFTFLTPDQELTPAPYCVNADTLDSKHAVDFPQSRANSIVYEGESVTLAIPHFQPWTLELAGGWPGSGGLCLMMGFENDNIIAITYTKYNGADGTSEAGGGRCWEGSTDTLVTFGSDGMAYTVTCPGFVPPYDPECYPYCDHHITLTATGILMKYRLVH